MMEPDTETGLAEIVVGAPGPLAVQGGGTRGLGVAGDGLSVAALSGIALYEPGALTLVARAGTPVREIEAVLAAENQRLAFEPIDHRALLGTRGVPTIGGVVAANVSGSRRIQAGACRDHVLGVRFVDGSGRIVKNGGRVMKNVTGYDLVKLMTGSFGTLGVLTEIALKVLPAPECSATLGLRGLTDHQAVTAMATALGSPWEVTGAAHLPAWGGDTSRTLLRIEGFAASVAYRAGELCRLLAEFGAWQTDDAPDWAWLGAAGPFHGASGDVWRVSVKPSDAPALAARSGAEQVYYDWGGGLIWLRTPEGYDLRAALGPFDGHATLVRASPGTRAELPVFHPQPPRLAAIAAGLRARFDPRGIFNPGLMGAR